MAEDPKTKPLTPPEPPILAKPAAPPAPPPPVVKKVQTPAKAVEEPPIKTVIIEEPTLRDKVASRLNIMLRADSWKERKAIANSILEMFPPQPEDTIPPE